MKYLVPFFNKKEKGPLNINWIDGDYDDNKPAYVTYKPLTLHVHKRVWEGDQTGWDRARRILAHEIGHLLLHDDTAKAFSSDPAFQLKFAINEYSAEWQARTFEKHFLAPEHIVRNFKNSDELAELCNLELEFASQRINEMKLSNKNVYIGDSCGECGNFTLVRNGTCLKCDTCGGTTGCS
jgi:hypothetical protein